MLRSWPPYTVFSCFILLATLEPHTKLFWTKKSFFFFFFLMWTQSGVSKQREHMGAGEVTNIVWRHSTTQPGIFGQNKQLSLTSTTVPGCHHYQANHYSSCNTDTHGSDTVEFFLGKLNNLVAPPHLEESKGQPKHVQWLENMYPCTPGYSNGQPVEGSTVTSKVSGIQLCIQLCCSQHKWTWLKCIF